MPLVIKAQVIENSAAVLLARVTTASGGYLKQSDVSSISVQVYDASTETKVGSTYTPTVSSVVYNSLQTDSRWSKDSTGFNLAISMAGSYWPEAGHYRVEVLVTPVSGDPFYVLWDLQALDILSA